MQLLGAVAFEEGDRLERGDRSGVLSIEGITLELLLEPVLSGDYIAARELWSKIPDADPVMLEDAVEKYIAATRDSKPRVRASAAAALGAMARFAPIEMPNNAMDMLLILTSDAVETVKDAAAEAIKQFKDGGEPAFEYGGDASVPEFKPVSTGSSTVREASDALPTFTPVEESQPEHIGPSFESAGIDEAPPVFKPADKQPSFKVVEDETPQFKPVAKQPSFKIVE